MIKTQEKLKTEASKRDLSSYLFNNLEFPPIVANSYTIMEQIIDILGKADPDQKANDIFEYLKTLETEKFLGFKNLFLGIDEEKQQNYFNQMKKFKCTPLEEVINLERKTIPYEDVKFPPDLIFDWKSVFMSNNDRVIETAHRYAIIVPDFESIPIRKELKRNSKLRFSLLLVNKNLKLKIGNAKKRIKNFLGFIKRKSLRLVRRKSTAEKEEIKEIKTDKVLQNMIKATNPNLKNHEKLARMMLKNKTFKEGTHIKCQRKGSLILKLESMLGNDENERKGAMDFETQMKPNQFSHEKSIIKRTQTLKKTTFEKEDFSSKGDFSKSIIGSSPEDKSEKQNSSKTSRHQTVSDDSKDKHDESNSDDNNKDLESAKRFIKEAVEEEKNNDSK